MNHHIRWMIRSDMPEVLDIESRCFEFPWREDDFIRCLRGRTCIGMVSEADCERIDGFMIYELHKTYLRIINFAVHPNHRRNSIGAAMVEKLKRKIAGTQRKRLVVEVRETNLDAQLFFRSQGFRAIRVLRDHYEDTPEDAYVFQYRMPVASEVTTC